MELHNLREFGHFCMGPLPRHPSLRADWRFLSTVAAAEAAAAEAAAAAAAAIRSEVNKWPPGLFSHLRFLFIFTQRDSQAATLPLNSN